MSNPRKSDYVGELFLRLQAPIIAMERVAQMRYLPKVFAQAALDELKKAQELTKKLEGRGKG